MQERTKRRIGYGILAVGIPGLIAAGLLLFEGRRYTLMSILMVIVAMMPLFWAFEKRKSGVRELVIIAVLTALSVMGRVIFAAVPAFKPVAAMVIITAIYFGAEAGFLCGALSALLSNIFFGQGPWTPFQMFAWGILGLIAGLPGLRQTLRDSKAALIIYGILAGIIYSLLMDVYSALSYSEDGLGRYLVMVAASAPYLVMYAISNAVFLVILTGPIGRRLERIQKKMGMEEGSGGAGR